MKRKSKSGWGDKYRNCGQFLTSAVVGQQKACATISGIMASHSMRREDLPGIPPPRCLIVGPTSSGKSHLAGNIVHWLQDPFAWVNVSLLTPPGYKGYDTNAAMMQLAKANTNDDGQKIPSVLILDEIDKAMRRAKDSSWLQWLQQLQYSLLPILGGEPINIYDDSGNAPDRLFYTQHTLVVMMGVFPEIPTRAWSNEMAARAALVKYGFCEEFVSRLTHIIQLKSLDRRDTRELVHRDASLIARSYRSPTFTPSLSTREVNQLIDQASTSPFGIRGSRVLMHRLLSTKAAQHADTN